MDATPLIGAVLRPQPPFVGDEGIRFPRLWEMKEGCDSPRLRGDKGGYS